MRLTTGLLLAVLISPWAQAELIDEVNDRGELRIAVLADTPPYTFKKDEHLTGFEIELGQALAQELDVRAEFIETPAQELLPGVENGKYDIALNQSNAEQASQAPLDTSHPYSRQSLVIPFQKDNPAFESALNNALQRIMDDGRLAAMERKWLENPVQQVAGEQLAP
ncbi:transporter substrate-binding domain-containing protein [Pseudomonas capeferrum]|uniref:transporter substrate-binding domain-containing protein n=1 Tax=Pseudomonas capeferrum TaxID=1495066 RepID=UPI0015E29896|nr:transporter substrate-binding domain-containing protein [Pseudomonas capeferrum]MBA1201588.1 transporter substrate-binding domain-containing protein [Pseudomonas capeferrum]